MRNQCDCKELVLLGTAVALEISQNMTSDELTKLAGLLVIISDELALLSLCAPEKAGNEEQEAAAALL
jgi:hypothetical protein